MKHRRSIDTLRELYVRSCEWRGRDEFFADERERIDGAEALRLSRAMADLYARAGAGAGEVVALLCRCSARHAVSWFAGMLNGRIVCNLHMRETPERIGESLRWLDARVLVHDEEASQLAREAVARSGRPIARIVLGVRGDAAFGWDDVVAARDATATTGAPATPAPAGDDVAAIILSSGSTGKPKGVAHTQRSLLEAAKGGQYALGGLNRHDCGLLYMQPSFAGWPIIVLPLVAAKSKVFFGAQFTPQGFLDTVERERVTLAPLVPTMWRMVFEEDVAKRDLSSLRMVTIAGEPPAPSDIASLHARICPRIASLYLSAEGLTASGVIAFTEDLLRLGKAASTGRPAPGVDVRIVDPAGGFEDELPVGETGEIVVSGPSMAAGYWNDDALTAQRFRDSWWRSGDLGRVDPEGDLWILGRIDNVINTGGIKVSGEEVERVLLGNPAVAQCAVIGVPDERFGRRIEAWIVARGAAPSAEALGAFCRDEAGLAGFKVPKAFHFVAALPTGPTGKLYRRALRGDAKPLSTHRDGEHRE